MRGSPKRQEPRLALFNIGRKHLGELMEQSPDKLRSLTGWSTLISALACYGTAAIVGVLGAIGIAVTVNNTAWAGAIVLFAAIAFGGLIRSFRSHRWKWPVLSRAISLAAIVYAMLIDYSRLLEFAGFFMLASGAVLDWRK